MFGVGYSGLLVPVVSVGRLVTTGLVGVGVVGFAAGAQRLSVALVLSGVCWGLVGRVLAGVVGWIGGGVLGWVGGGVLGLGVIGVAGVGLVGCCVGRGLVGGFCGCPLLLI